MQRHVRNFNLSRQCTEHEVCAAHEAEGREVSAAHEARGREVGAAH